MCFDNVVCDWWGPLLNTSCCRRAEVMEIRVTVWQIGASDWLFFSFYLGHRDVCHNKVFCSLAHSLCFPVCLFFLCVCARPFPSEDTALNEDDVYRSLEELAEWVTQQTPTQICFSFSGGLFTNLKSIPSKPASLAQLKLWWNPKPDRKPEINQASSLLSKFKSSNATELELSGFNCANLHPLTFILIMSGECHFL